MCAAGLRLRADLMVDAAPGVLQGSVGASHAAGGVYGVFSVSCRIRGADLMSLPSTDVSRDDTA